MQTFFALPVRPWPVLVAFAIGCQWVAVSPRCLAQATAPATATEALDQVQFQVSVSQDTAQVAQPISFSISVIAPKGARVRLPAISADLGKFDVTEIDDAFDLPMGGESDKRRWVRQLTLETIRTGRQEIPALQASVSIDGQGKTLVSDPLVIQVVSVLENRPDPTNPRPIRSVIDVDEPEPEPESNWHRWAWGGGGFIVFLALALLAFKRRRPRISAETWALTELSVLRDSGVIAEGHAQLVTSELSAILREYAELELAINSASQSAEQFVTSLTEQNCLSNDTLNEYHAIFQQIELTSFAGLAMAPGELERLTDRVENLIKTTANELETARRALPAEETSEATFNGKQPQVSTGSQEGR